jgi:hypothetical protein
VIPALQSSDPDLIETINETARGASAGMQRQRLRSALVALEISFALVILIGTGLMLTHFSGLTTLQRAAIRATLLRSRCGCRPGNS